MIVGVCERRKTALRTLVVSFDTAHCSNKNTVCLTFPFIRQHELWNNAYLRIAMVVASAGTLL